jgi:hypothetical protein
MFVVVEWLILRRQCSRLWQIVELVGAELVECPQPVVARKRLMTSVLKLMASECSSNDTMCLEGVRVSRECKRLRTCS